MSRGGGGGEEGDRVYCEEGRGGDGIDSTDHLWWKVN